jgi:hypothetical protein
MKMKMNQRKLILIGLISIGITIHSENPEKWSENFIKKLKSDAAITDSQCVLIKQKISVFFLDIKNADKNKSNDSQSLKTQTSENFKIQLDSILTSEQRQRMKLKLIEKKNNKKSLKNKL